MKKLILALLLSLACFTCFGFSTPPQPILADIKPYSHAKDFRWISGQLKFDSSAGWNVVYTKNVNPELAEYGTDDALERVRLYSSGTKFDSMNFKVPKGIQAGDIVLIQGTLSHVMEITNGQKAGRTMYEVKSIRLLPE